MNGLVPTKGSSWYRLTLANADPPRKLVVDPLVAIKEGIDSSLDIIDVSTWTGDAKNGHFISGQLRLLRDTIRDAGRELKGISNRKGWHEIGMDPKVCTSPPISPESIEQPDMRILICPPKVIRSTPPAESFFPSLRHRSRPSHRAAVSRSHSEPGLCPFRFWLPRSNRRRHRGVEKAGSR